jgi:hypothetical protein
MLSGWKSRLGVVSYLHLTRLDPVQQRHRFNALSWRPCLFDESALLRSGGLTGASGCALMTGSADRRNAQPVMERLVHR